VIVDHDPSATVRGHERRGHRGDDDRAGREPKALVLARAGVHEQAMAQLVTASCDGAESRRTETVVSSGRHRRCRPPGCSTPGVHAAPLPSTDGPRDLTAFHGPRRTKERTARRTEQRPKTKGRREDPGVIHGRSTGPIVIRCESCQNCGRPRDATSANKKPRAASNLSSRDLHGGLRRRTLYRRRQRASRRTTAWPMISKWR